MTAQSDPFTITLGDPSESARERYHEGAFCDGRLLVASPREPSWSLGALLDSLGEDVEREVLVLGMGQWTQSVLALAIENLHPRASVDFFSFEAFEQRRAMRTFRGHGSPGMRCILGADLPDEERYDWVLLSLSRTGDKAFTGDCLRQVWSALRTRGKVVLAIDSRRDQWVRKQVQEVFGDVTIAQSSEGGLVYVARKKPGTQIRRRNYTRSFQATLFDVDLELESRPGVFSHGELDEGTLALSEIAEPKPDGRIVDMGCGSGAIGIAAARSSLWCRVLMVDSNLRAVQAARRNVLRNHVTSNALVLPGFHLGAVREGSVDYVLANPPYYGSFRISELFVREAFRLLRSGGELALVTKAPDEHCLLLQEVFGDGEIFDRRGYTVFRVLKS